MKRILAVLCLASIMLFTLASSALAAVSGQAGSSSIRVSLTELTPGYYLCAVWDGDELLTLFDYTVGNDGKMETTIDVGKTLQSSDDVQLGISGANAGAEDVRIDVAISSSGSNPGDGSSGGNNNGGGSNSSANDSGHGDFYAVKLPSNLSGGRLSAQPTRAEVGTTVIVNIAPDAGYTLDNIQVRAENSEFVKLNNLRSNRVMFTMPNAAVNVSAAFKELNVYSGSFYSLPFTDVRVGEWYYQAIHYVFSEAIMNGESQTLFNPNGRLNRAMLVVSLHRLENQPRLFEPSGFKDVPAGQWYTEAVVWAKASGIVNGYENGKFEPMQDICREELAAILYRYAQFKDLPVDARGDLKQFRDGASVSDWATEAMRWAIGVGILSGDEQGALTPLAGATRAEVAAMLMRYCENVAK